MKRLALVFILLAALAACVAAAPGQGGGIRVSLIVPPAVRRAVAFPVVAVVTNTRPQERINLRKIHWRLARNEFAEDLAEDLAPSGDAARIVDDLMRKKNALTPMELETLRSQRELLRSGSVVLRFLVTAETAAEILDKGPLSLGVAVEGEEAANRNPVAGYAEAALAPGRPLVAPPLPPGAHRSDWYFGDTHSHSTYTTDFYFGDGIYTIPELKSAALAAGLDWLVLTDHAYCLNSTKFGEQKSALTALSDGGFAFLYGEELSCAELVNGVKAYDTCHYNGILNSAFVSCATDFFRKASSPDSQQGINYLKQYGGLVTINHPNWGTGSLESWNFNINTYPYTHGETGIEILNGAWDDTNNGSATRWIDRRLLKGEKVFPFAGSDTESSNHLGECSTVVYADYLTQGDVRANLERGHHYATTYPGLAAWARPSGAATWSWMGDTLAMGAGTAEVYISYSDAYDGLRIYVQKGRAGWTAEQTVYSTTVGMGGGSLTINAAVEPGCYLRVYCLEISDGDYRAYTTPIWFN